MTPVPTWEEFMVPVLKVLCDGQARHVRVLSADVADCLGLTAEQRAETIASGQLRASHRVNFACSFLRRVGALDRPERGTYKITDLGRRLLAEHPGGLSERTHLRPLASEDDKWWLAKPFKSAGTGSPESVEAVDTVLDPIEQVTQGVARIHEDVASQLLRRLRAEDPGFFEAAVVKLLVAMGYGGTGGSANVTPLVRDGGIDGIVDQDVLGLAKVYVQAKRYADGNVVGRPDVQSFVGALTGRAGSGVFITTSRFTKDAQEYAAGLPSRVVLVDGPLLTELMIRYGVGVQVRHSYNVVELDEDFFS